MFYKSVRFKMSIVYMAILAIILTIFSLILYHYVELSLNDNMDSLLQTKGDGIVHAINAYWAAERLGPNRFGSWDESVRFEKIDFATIAQRWVQEKSKDPKLLDIIIQIFTPDGSVVASSKNTQGITSVSKDIFNAVLEGKSSFGALTSSFPTKKMERFRVFITPAVENDKVEYVVQVASPLNSIQTTLNILRIAIFVLFPMTVLLTGVMGAFLAKLTLRPVNNMTKTIHEITAENMKQMLKIPDTKDEIQQLAETFNDMLVRLDSAFTSQKQLFENLSHDLKTPLTILKGEFEVMLKKIRTSEEYEAVLKSSLEEINKISRLVENLLLLASFDSRKILPDNKNIDLGLLIYGVGNTIKKAAVHKRVETAISAQEGVVVKGDEQQLKHLFLNLLDNAVKYTPEGGKVSISMIRRENHAIIAITDTGIGIQKDKISRIFDRFYRVDESRTSHGFGLGLSIVRSIVDAHKGKIDVESSPGIGSVFTVTLPVSMG